MKKRLLSLIMAVMMVVVLVVPAAAATTTTNEPATVTVYITEGLFDEGGFANGAPRQQAYIKDGEPDASDWMTQLPFDEDFTPMVLDSDTIAALMDRSLYSAPDSYTEENPEPNVLDAIIVALMLNGYTDIAGGWDTINTPNGGYIHTVAPVQPTYQPTTQETIAGTTYNVYRGFGWNIACTQGDSIQAISLYGTNYSLTDGMVIVFDFSAYTLYDVN